MKVITSFQPINFRKVCVFFVMQSILFLTIAVGVFGQSSLAMAANLTPDRAMYQSETTADEAKIQTGRAKDNLEYAANNPKNVLEEVKDNVVEKLNLNEPVPESTKKFVKQVQGKEPIESPLDKTIN
ncbi:MAG: hypothetical protein ACRC2V_20245 [Xenococcaceae cyanobacterium]